MVSATTEITTTDQKSGEAYWSVPDWRREKPARFWDPGRKLLKALRECQQQRKGNIVERALLSRLSVLRHRFWSIVCGAEIPLNCKISGGFKIPHPQGVVVHPDSKIGPNCLLFQQVTLAGKVEMGHHVEVGAGAKILGPVKIGDNVRVGANAVVTHDVPSGDTVVGIPAHSLNDD